MTRNSEWQEANRELMEEARRRLGGPPTEEEMLAFGRGELPEAEEERIRELLVAYPEVARLYGEPFPEAPRAGDPDFVPESRVDAGWHALQARLGIAAGSSLPNGAGPRQARVFSFRHLPTTIAAALALVFFGLFVHAESRARQFAREGALPRVLGAAQELMPTNTRGSGPPTMLRKDGEAYLLQPRLGGQVRYPAYVLELRHGSDVIWENRSARPDQEEAFQITVPHHFLREGEAYRLDVYGVNGETREQVAGYDLAVPVE